MNEKEIHELAERLAEAIEKPIPKDSKSRILRSIWLALMCVSGCRRVLDRFFMEFGVDPKEEEKMKVLFEMSVLAVATAAEVVEDRLKKEFVKKKESVIADIFGDCEVVLIDTLHRIFNDRNAEEIFDIYASYTWFEQLNILQEKTKTPFNEWLEKNIRDWAKIGKSVHDKEHHFANRVSKIFGGIDLDELAEFAKRDISIQGLLLAMDAFASVEQEQINKKVAQFFSILGNESGRS
jgi:hypothetical protein